MFIPLPSLVVFVRSTGSSEAGLDVQTGWQGDILCRELRD